MKRPLRITIISIYLLLSSTIALLSYLAQLLSDNPTEALISNSIPTWIISLNTIVGGLLTIACAIFMFLGKAKARKILSGYYFYSFVFGIINISTIDVSKLAKMTQGMVSASDFKLISYITVFASLVGPLSVLYSKKSNKFFSSEHNLEKIRAQNLKTAGHNDQVGSSDTN